MCLSIVEINSYIDGFLTETDILRAEEHLGECALCSSIVSKFSLIRNSVSTLPVKQVSSDFADRLIHKINYYGSSHPSFEKISAYFDNVLAPYEQKELEIHLQLCSSCNNIYENLKSLESTSKSLDNYIPSPDFAERLIAVLDDRIVPHPSFASLSAYYDKTLSPFEAKAVQEHLSDCSECNNTLDKINFGSGTVTKPALYTPSPDFLDNLMKKIDELPLPDFYEEEVAEPAAQEKINLAESECISSEDLSAYIDNEKASVTTESIKNHLEECSRCQSKIQSFVLSRKITGNLVEPSVPFNFSRKVIEKINIDKQSTKVVPFFRRNVHKVSMVAGIVIAGVLVSMSNPFGGNDTLQQANISVSVMAEDFLFPADTRYNMDSLDVIADTKETRDPFLVQEIGF